jgi:hypothetical protein
MSTRKRCPKGQHRYKGECVKKEILVQEKGLKPPRKRRTVKKGERALTPVLEEEDEDYGPTPPLPTQPMPKYPPAVVLQKQGSVMRESATPVPPLVPLQEMAVEEKTIDKLAGLQVPKSRSRSRTPSNKGPTPRTVFAQTYFTKPVTLLNKYHSDKTGRLMFQVSFNSPDQFTNYANLSKQPKIDCFYQSLFSIGLRDAEQSKRDSSEVNEKGEKGVHTYIQQDYLRKLFGLRANQIHEVYTGELLNDKGLHDNKLTTKAIHTTFTEKLSNNHATILLVFFYKWGKLLNGHAMIAYKHKDKIYYFDPQQKGVKDYKTVNSKTLAHLIKYSGNTFIGGFAYFEINELPEPREPQNLVCDIPYVG